VWLRYSGFSGQREIDRQIVELRGGKRIDATCYNNKTGQHITVELRKTLSRASWNHSVDGVDYVVCWEIAGLGFPKPVITLRDLVKPKVLFDRTDEIRARAFSPRRSGR
jgi:hypothetical protein